MREALSCFATAYGGTGHSLSCDALELADDAGRIFDVDALLPCGLAVGADAFVRSSSPPTALPEAAAGAAAAAAAVAAAAAARATAAVAAPVATGAHVAPQPKGVFAKPGSAIAASQAKMGENSYYYSVGKNRGVPGSGTSSVEAPAPPPPPPAPTSVRERPATLAEQTLSTYSMLDDDANIKVHVPFAGAAALVSGAISCDFRERSFDLRVTTTDKCATHLAPSGLFAGGRHAEACLLIDGFRPLCRLLRLHIPILSEEIDALQCAVKKKAGKLIIVLRKRDESKGWYELRKTKVRSIPASTARDSSMGRRRETPTALKVRKLVCARRVSETPSITSWCRTPERAQSSCCSGGAVALGAARPCLYRQALLALLVVVLCQRADPKVTLPQTLEGDGRTCAF